MRDKTILIAGAGIGGLSTALGLLRAGFKVQVFEQAPELREIGAGVSLAPNATRALASLGVLDAVRAQGHIPNRAAIKHYRSGEALSGYELGAGVEQQWGAPYVQIHRADLQTILAAAVCSHDAAAIHFGARVEAVQQDASQVTLATAAGTFTGACLVGADGIRSAVRHLLYDAQPPPFLGYVAWRAVLPASLLRHHPLEPDTAVFLGPRKSLLRYKVRGGELVNIAAFSQSDAWAEEGWSLPADPTELRAAYAGWADEVQDLVDAMCQVGAFKWGLFGRPQLAQWQRGRVTLVGDAAHPMLPFRGQGAAMAIEDGVLLARALAAGPTVERAFQRYEATRYERATSIVIGADLQGRKLHGHPVDDAESTLPVPKDDFAEYRFDASTVELAP